MRADPLLHTGAAEADLAREGGALRLARGRGAHVWDSRGRRYLDAVSGYWTASVGYGRRSVARAAGRQLERLSYAPLDWRSHAPAERLAARLAELAPGTRKVFLCSGGSEALDSALKLARLWALRRGEAERSLLIYRRGSYHGATLAATGACGIPELREPYRPLLPPALEAPQPDCGRCEEGSGGAPSPGAGAPSRPEECSLRCVDALEAAARSAGPGRVLAVVAEPVCAASRVLVPRPGYWPALRRLCDRLGALLVADEVLTGAGRTGRWLALEHWGVRADLTLMGKGLTGGYAPLGAVLLGGRAAEPFLTAPFDHGYTFGGHPGSCAAALEVLRIVRREGLVERAADSGRRLLAEVRQAAARHGSPGPVTGLGLLASVGLDLGPSGARELRRRLLSCGFLAHVEADALAVAPPLSSGPAVLAEVARGVEEGLRFAAGLRARAACPAGAGAPSLGAGAPSLGARP